MYVEHAKDLLNEFQQELNFQRLQP